MPVGLGTGLDEDRGIVFRQADMVAYVMPPRIIKADQASVTTGQIEFISLGYLAAFPYRWPGGVAILSGSGTARPTGY